MFILVLLLFIRFSCRFCKKGFNKKHQIEKHEKQHEQEEQEAAGGGGAAGGGAAGGGASVPTAGQTARQPGVQGGKKQDNKAGVIYTALLAESGTQGLVQENTPTGAPVNSGILPGTLTVDASTHTKLTDSTNAIIGGAPDGISNSTSVMTLVAAGPMEVTTQVSGVTAEVKPGVSVDPRVSVTDGSTAESNPGTSSTIGIFMQNQPLGQGQQDQGNSVQLHQIQTQPVQGQPIQGQSVQLQQIPVHILQSHISQQCEITTGSLQVKSDTASLPEGLVPAQSLTLGTEHGQLIGNQVLQPGEEITLQAFCPETVNAQPYQGEQTQYVQQYVIPHSEL